MAMAEQSEFSWGNGLQAPQGRGYVPSAFDRLKATRLTDHDNPDASEEAVLEFGVSVSGLDEDGIYIPGNQRMNTTVLVQESEATASSGQFTPIDPSRYNRGHESDGEQDGSGAAWRASVPPNRV